MANTPEGKVKDVVKSVVSEYEAIPISPMGGYHGNNSVPDVLLCHHGLFYGVEIKATYPIPTEAQIEYLLGVYESGGVVACIGGKGMSVRMAKKTGLPLGAIAWWSHKSVPAQYKLSTLPVNQCVDGAGFSDPRMATRFATHRVMSQSILTARLVWGCDPDIPEGIGFR